MHRVCFHPSGKSVHVSDGVSLLRAALDGGMPLASSCDGTGICRACRIRVLEGAMNLSPLTSFEREAVDEASSEDGERLACLALVHGPVRITTSYW